MQQEDLEKILAQAIGGDAEALEQALLIHYPKLLAYINRHFPADLRQRMGPEDVLQEAYIEVVRGIGGFKPNGPDSFYRWAATIARHKLADAIEAYYAVKRGGRVGHFKPAYNGTSDTGSLNGLLNQLRAGGDTPSQGMRAKEAVAALQVAIASLPEDMREVIQHHYIADLTIEQTAARMGRTPGAVRMLSHRAMQRLRATMGRASAYLSSTT
jgi:RNA polymerase sigma-70 factor, ECF subfamily